MTLYIFLVFSPFLFICLIQYFFCERYLVKLKGKYALGYFLHGVLMIFEVLYGVYVLFFVEYMEALGIAMLMLGSYLHYGFSKRYSNMSRNSI